MLTIRILVSFSLFSALAQAQSSECSVETIGGNDPFSSISGLAVGPDGEVYVADEVRGTINVIRRDGNVERLASAGETGGDAEEGRDALDSAIEPSGLAVDSGAVGAGRERVRLFYSRAGGSPDGCPYSRRL